MKKKRNETKRKGTKPTSETKRNRPTKRKETERNKLRALVCDQLYVTQEQNILIRVLNLSSAGRDELEAAALIASIVWATHLKVEGDLPKELAKLQANGQSKWKPAWRRHTPQARDQTMFILFKRIRYSPTVRKTTGATGLRAQPRPNFLPMAIARSAQHLEALCSHPVQAQPQPTPNIPSHRQCLGVGKKKKKQKNITTLGKKHENLTNIQNFRKIRNFEKTKGNKKTHTHTFAAGSDSPRCGAAIQGGELLQGHDGARDVDALGAWVLFPQKHPKGSKGSRRGAV